jgi:class 3 adenylate cyclase
MPAPAFTVRMNIVEPIIYSAHAVGSTALATERVERRLAAILTADVVGYTFTDQHETKLRDLSV